LLKVGLEENGEDIEEGVGGRETLLEDIEEVGKEEEERT
jgi:hypothetical protein